MCVNSVVLRHGDPARRGLCLKVYYVQRTTKNKLTSEKCEVTHEDQRQRMQGLLFAAANSRS